MRATTRALPAKVVDITRHGIQRYPRRFTGSRLLTPVMYSSCSCSGHDSALPWHSVSKKLGSCREGVGGGGVGWDGGGCVGGYVGGGAGMTLHWETTEVGWHCAGKPQRWVMRQDSFFEGCTALQDAGLVAVRSRAPRRCSPPAAPRPACRPRRAVPSGLGAAGRCAHLDPWRHDAGVLDQMAAEGEAGT